MCRLSLWVVQRPNRTLTTGRVTGGCLFGSVASVVRRHTKRYEAISVPYLVSKTLNLVSKTLRPSGQRGVSCAAHADRWLDFVLPPTVPNRMQSRVSFREAHDRLLRFDEAGNWKYRERVELESTGKPKLDKKLEMVFEYRSGATVICVGETSEHRQLGSQIASAWRRPCASACRP